jgi:hypothetical protein
MAVNVTDMAVALAALPSILGDEVATPEECAARLVAQASKIRFQPSTRQLVLTFDLTFGVAEPEQ